MNRCLLIFPLAAWALASALMAGCADSQSVEIRAYLEQVVPIMERHGDTMETTDGAYKALAEANYSGDEDEIQNKLSDFQSTLSWALSRVESELSDFMKLAPPADAGGFHSLLLEGLQKRQYWLTNWLSYYSSVLEHGSGDEQENQDGYALLLESQDVWQRAGIELQRLQETVQD